MRLYRNIILHLVATLISVATYAQSGEITILAHRGGCGEGMENTLGTIRKSLDAGIKAFEIDLRITKDGTIVLQHDDTLKRTAGIERCIEEMTDKEVRENPGFAAYFVDHTAGVYPTAASGFPWNAASMQVKGDLIADLTEDLAAEQKARVTYDNILRLSDDPDVNDVIKFLRQREIVHFQRFGEGLRLAKEKMDQKNLYFINPSFDQPV